MINKVILVGNIGNEPETKEIKEGLSITTISLATSESYKDKQGEWQSKTAWHKIKVWNASKFIQSLSKGQQLYVEGSIEYSSTEQEDGTKRYYTDIKARVVRPVGGSQKESSPQMATATAGATGEDDLPF